MLKLSLLMVRISGDVVILCVPSDSAQILLRAESQNSNVPNTSSETTTCAIERRAELALISDATCVGALVLLALAFLTPMFYYIPDAALAAVIIMAVTDMINFSMVKHLWTINSTSSAC